jgi:hypothetical protein
MVQRISRLFLLVSLSTAPVLRADLDLTPATATRHLESFSFPELIFSDGSQQVSYEFPRGWSYSLISSKQIRFNPPQLAQARAEIEAVPLTEGFAFDEKSIKKLREETVRGLPKNSTQIQILSEVTNALLINGHKTYEVTIAYMCYGQRYQTSVLFANLDRQQLRCRVLAQASDFEKIHRTFSDTLCSLQWLKAGT